MLVELATDGMRVGTSVGERAAAQVRRLGRTGVFVWIRLGGAGVAIAFVRGRVRRRRIARVGRWRLHRRIAPLIADASPRDASTVTCASLGSSAGVTRPRRLRGQTMTPHRRRRISRMCPEYVREGRSIRIARPRFMRGPMTRWEIQQARRVRERGAQGSKPLVRQPKTRVEPLEAASATQIGLLLAASRTADIADAHVVICALQHDDVIVTSDPADMRRLNPRARIHSI
jgi:hypothetical protein